MHGSALLCTGFLQKRGLLSSCDERTSRCGAFSHCGAQALGALASVVVLHRLNGCGSRAAECGLSSCGTRA